MHPSAAGRPDYVVIYDGTCNVCGRLARTLARLDRGSRLEIIASQSPEVTSRFPSIPSTAYTESLQLVGAGGERWEGAAAIEQLVTVLPRGRLFSWMFSLPLARGFADGVYRWFARNRHHLGCGTHCQSRPRHPG